MFQWSLDINDSWHSNNTKVILTADLSSNVSSEQPMVRVSISPKIRLSLAPHTFIHTYISPPLCLMSVSVCRLCANTLFQKSNLLVVSERLPPLFFPPHYLSRSDLFLWVFRGFFLCWYVREFTSRVNKKDGRSNWSASLPCRGFYQIACLIDHRLLQRPKYCRRIEHQRWHLHAAVARQLICSPSIRKQRDSPLIKRL